MLAQITDRRRLIDIRHFEPGWWKTEMQFGQLTYRELVSLLAAAAVAWPLAARAQPPPAPGIPKESSPDPTLAKAVAAVNEKLKDPQSVRYGDMVRKVGPNVNGKPAEVVCGSVTANDSFGASGAKRPFVYFIADGAVFLVDAKPSPEDVAQIIYGRFCK